MIVLPMIMQPNKFCLYREDGEQIIFSINEKKIIRHSSIKLYQEEIQFIYKKYINEDRP